MVCLGLGGLGRLWPQSEYRVCCPAGRDPCTMPASREAERTISLWASLRSKPHGRSVLPMRLLRPLNVKYWCVTVHRNSCTNQLTGIHLSQAESPLSGHTSIYMVKHQICKVPYTGRPPLHPLAVGVPACTSLTREVFVIQSVRDGGQYSQSGYAFSLGKLASP